MDVLVLLVRHGTDKYSDALDSLDRLYQAQAPGLARRTIVIDNSLPAAFSEDHGPQLQVIGGDNTSWEFSGWQRAIDGLAGEIKRYDAVHFVTSAYRTLYTDYLKRFSPQIVEVVARHPVCTGHIDYYPHPIRFGHTISRHWVRTSFWLLNPSELMRLGNLASVHDKPGLFSRKDDWPFDRNGLLSPGYQKLIHDWLTSDRGTGQSTSWHSRIDLNDERNRAFFEQKAMAIMNEQLLSVRLRAQGTSTLDMTYLAEVTERGDHLPDHLPSWREQMRLRKIPGHDSIEHAKVR